MEKINVCSVCHFASKKMMSCSGCRATHYCGAVCQKKDWKKHKFQCKALKELKAILTTYFIGDAYLQTFLQTASRYVHKNNHVPIAISIRENEVVFTICHDLDMTPSTIFDGSFCFQFIHIVDEVTTCVEVCVTNDYSQDIQLLKKCIIWDKSFVSVIKSKEKVVLVSTKDDVLQMHGYKYMINGQLVDII